MITSSDPQNILLIINPLSSGVDVDFISFYFRQRCAEKGIRCDIALISHHNELKNIIQTAISNGCSTVIAAGGDGTVSSVANHLVGKSVTLGILPLGTWNALARNFGIPLITEDAIQLILGPHQVKSMDVMKAGKNHFLLNVSTGFSSKLMKATLRQHKKRFGIFAYLWHFIQTLFGLQEQKFYLEIDGTRKTVRALEVMVVNSSLIGMGEIPTSLQIFPDDGRLEVCVIGAKTGWDLLLVIGNILLRQPSSAPNFSYYYAQKLVQIRTKNPTIVQADGEVIGHSPLDVKLIPNAIKLILPNPNLFVRPPFLH